MTKRIILFGLKRTGTALIKWILEHNWSVKVLTNDYGYKHGPYCASQIPSRYSDIPVIVTVRNPLTQLISYYQYLQFRSPYPETNPGSFEGWLKKRIKGQDPIRLWNFAYGYWAWRLSNWEVTSRCSTFARFRDILKDPLFEVGRLGVALNLGHRESEKLVLPENEYVALDFLEREEGFFQVKERELGGEERERFYSPELEHFVWTNMDLDVLMYYGYGHYHEW